MAIIKVKTGGITADAITDALIADDVVGTEHLTANEVDTAALKADAVTGAELADNAINSEHYTDGSIDTAHIADAQITAAKLASGVGGITMADQWRLVTDRASDEDPIGSSSTLERVDDASFGKIGTGMTNTSGIFSFPETGTYLVKAKGEGLQTSADDNNFDMEIMATTDNSSYDRTVFMRMGFTSAPNTANVNGSCLVNVDNISNVKVKFKLGSSNSNTLKGNTAYSRTFFTFIRLGDST